VTLNLYIKGQDATTVRTITNVSIREINDPKHELHVKDIAGSFALNLDTATGNVNMGLAAGGPLQNGTGNVYIGQGCAANADGGVNNTCIGPAAYSGTTGQYNTCLGGRSR
jgi:hypothetical protein